MIQVKMVLNLSYFSRDWQLKNQFVIILYFRF